LKFELSKCFVIAEAGVNHNGDAKKAHQMIDVAAQARVDAIKFQTFIPEKLAAPSAKKAAYQLKSTGKSGSQLEMLADLVLPKNAYQELFDHATEHSLIFLSTPFDEQSAEFLAHLGMEAFKISSGDLTNLPLLAFITQWNRPVLLSTGMANIDEVQLAVQTIRNNTKAELALFHCVSNYPARPQDCNLRAMMTMQQAFQVPVGWSDHTLGSHVALAAVALGASFLEKHFTLDRTLLGPDHLTSLQPDELAAMVSEIRQVEAALGNGKKYPVKSEFSMAQIARRSLHWNCSLGAGRRITANHLIALRPAGGIAPNRLQELMGKRVNKAVEAGSMVNSDDLENA
jgi:N-acetylneuraminate synthase/N,N'-diacetyllegionaminate synthase